MTGEPNAPMTPEQLKWASSFTGLDVATATRVKAMDADFHAAVSAKDWAKAAVIVNGYGADDLKKHLKALSPDQLAQLHQGALDGGIGPDSAAAKATQAAAGTAAAGGNGLAKPGNGKKPAPGPAPAAQADPRLAKLDADYEAAVKAKDWKAAAELLNAFSQADIQARLAKRTAAEVAALNAAAMANPKVGPDAQVTKLTAAGSPNAQVSAGLGAEAHVRDISASAVLAADQVLYHEGDNTLKVSEATTIMVTARPSGLEIMFSPPLLIVSHNVLDWNIKLSSARTDFAGKNMSFDWDASFIPKQLGGIDKKLEAAMRKNIIDHLPARMSAAGYDLYADPKLEADLATLAKSIAPKAGGGGAAPKASNVVLRADIALAAELRSGPVSCPAGTQVAVTVALEGEAPASLDDAKISSVALAFSGTGATFNVKVLKTDLPVIFVDRVTLTKGGKLSLGYTLATEALEAGVRLILASIGAHQGIRVGADALDPREPHLRKLVDDLVHTKVEPMLRDIIVKNKGAIPGLDLVKALGL